MKVDSNAVELEIMPPEVTAVSLELSAPADQSLRLFTPFQKPFAAASELLAKEPAAVDATSARRLRLDMVKARTAIAATKKAAKADIVLAENVIDWYHNKGRDSLAAAEERLEAIEKAEERAEFARKAELNTRRLTELAAVGTDGKFYSLGDMPEAAYAQLLTSSKLAHDTKLAAEAKAKEDVRIAAEKAEAERVAREKAEAEERERIRVENDRLKKEAEARDVAAKIERDRIAKEKAEAEAAMKAEREKAEAASRAAAEIARKEREVIEAKAAAEKKEADRLAAIEREKREVLERAEATRVATEKKRQHEEAEAARRAAAAPDQDKLKAFAELVKTLEVPTMETAAGKECAERVAAGIKELVAVVRREWLALQGGGK